MAGVAIDRVRDTLRLSLRALPTASKFNIIGFGSTVDPLFAQSVKYTEAHVEIALEYVNQRVHADLGGTELLQPLRAALRAPVVDGYPRQILLLTGTAWQHIRPHIELSAKCGFLCLRCCIVALCNGESDKTQSLS